MYNDAPTLRLMDEVEVREQTLNNMNTGLGTHIETIIHTSLGVVTAYNGNGLYQVRCRDQRGHLTKALRVHEKNIRRLSEQEIEAAQRTTIPTGNFDGSNIVPNKQGKMRLMLHHVDGLKNDADITEWGCFTREYGIDLACLTDTRTNERNSDYWKHTFAREMGKDSLTTLVHSTAADMGGCMRVTKNTIAKRVGNEMSHHKARFDDEGGLYSAVKFIGKKIEGVTPSVLIINLLTPLPGSSSKKGLFDTLEEKLGKDPISNMINNIALLLSEEAGPATMVIMGGDMNCNMVGSMTTQQKSDGREEYRKEWEKKVLEPHGLVNAYAHMHKSPTSTYRTKACATWIDHIFVTERAMNKEDPYVSAVAVATRFEKTEYTTGLLGSCHLPLIMDIDAERWLHLNWANGPDAQERFQPVLKSGNKKRAKQYTLALDEIEELRLHTGETISLERAQQEMQTNIDEARAQQHANDIPERIDAITHAIQEAMVVNEQQLITDKMRERQKKKGFRQIWTPQEAHRAYNFAQVRRTLGIARKYHWNAHKIRAQISETALKVLEEVGLQLPTTNNYITWQKWSEKTHSELRTLGKEQHTRQRKMTLKARKGFAHKLEKQRKLGITKRYISVALKRDTKVGLPTHMTHTVGGHEVILDSKEEIKDVLTAITKKELGENRKCFHSGSEGKGSDLILTRENEQGATLRRTMAYGTQAERQEILDTLPKQYHEAAKNMKLKDGATRREKGHYMKLIESEKWKKAIQRKKSGTRPGPGNLTVDMLKAANETFTELTRLMANTAIAHRKPLTDWIHSWCYKLPKTQGIPKATKLRPLRFLNVMRKITLACVKDAMVSDWSTQNILPKDQYAFLPGRSTIPAALMRRMLLEDAYANHKNLYLLDLDLSGGYDRIQKWVLHAALLRFGVDEDTISFILNTASMCTVGVLTAFGECEAFKPVAGALAQGCDTSCALWVCLTDWWLDTMQTHNTNPYEYQTGKNTTENLFACIYADDGTWCQSDRNAIERCLQGANDFCDFTGQEISAAKSHALAVEWAANKSYETPTQPLQLKLWRTKGNAKDPDITTSLSEVQYPSNMSYTNWALYHESTETVEWKPVSEHIRHLGNTQSADGSHCEMVNQMTKDMRTATRALQRKVIKTLGAQQIANIVLTPKMKYQMVLSNTNEAEINKIQTIVKDMLCKKHRMCSKTRNSALWGNINGMGWDRWWHVVNCERTKIISNALATKGTTLHHLIRGAIHRLQRATGTDENITETLRPIVNKERNIHTEWAYQTYTWMRAQGVTVTMPPEQAKIQRANDRYLVDLDMEDNSIMARYTEHACRLSDVVEHDGVTLNPGSPMRDDKEWITAIQKATHTTQRKNQLQEKHKLGTWHTETTQPSTEPNNSPWKWSMDEANKLWLKRENNTWTEYKRTGPTENEWMPHNGQTTGPAGTIRRCIIAKTYPKTIPKKAGQPYRGNVPHTCTMDSCLDKYKDLRPASEKDDDVATVTEWKRGGPRVITFHLEWDKPDESGTTVKTTIGKTLLDEMTNDSHATTTNLTKCNNCFEAYCNDHNTTEIQETGWQQAQNSTKSGQYGTWLCPKCVKINATRRQQKSVITVIHTAETVDIITSAAQHTETQPHTWLEEHKDKNKWVQHAITSETPLCRIYSDGSAKHTQGSYGWIAGVEVGRSKHWYEIARGGGVEKTCANPARKITSARTEALGVLRAKQYIEKVWPGRIEIRLDNTTVVHRHNGIGENNRKRWNKVDNDIWDQMSNTRRQNCATIHVKGHADSKKKKGDITEHEHLNITCDHIAEQMYTRAKALELEHSTGWGYERTNATSTTIREGDCKIRGHRVVGNNTKTIMSFIGTEIALEYWNKDWKKYSAKHNKDEDVIQIDELLMKSIQKGEMHMPAIGTYTKILHGILATNHILTQRKDPKTKTDKCECCTANKTETNNHMLGKCTHESITEIRNKMITKLHKTIDNTLRHGKEKMAINPTVTKALCLMWSGKTIEHVAAHTDTEPTRPNMEHVWDWIGDEDTQKCLQEITKPGARLMWAGTFTKNWTTNLTKMGINEATSLKLARKIRKQIMHNTAEIWRTRCNVTHDNKEREEIIRRMRETANDAQKHGVLPNANESVQRACEIHKKIAERKKWIATTEKRTAKAIKEKTNRQKLSFMKHFSVGNNRSPPETDAATQKDPSAAKEKRPQKRAKKTAREGEEDETRIHRAITNKQTTTRKATLALESSDSDEENPPRNEKSPRKKAKTKTGEDEDGKMTHRDKTDKQTSTLKATKAVESSDSEEEPPQKHKTSTAEAPKRKRTAERPGTRDANSTQTLPPKGDAATEGEGTERGRQGKRKKQSNAAQKKQKKKKTEDKEKKRKREPNNQNQRKLDEFMQPATKPRSRETTRAQEEAKKQQSRSQDSYDPG